MDVAHVYGVSVVEGKWVPLMQNWMSLIWKGV